VCSLQSAAVRRRQNKKIICRQCLAVMAVVAGPVPGSRMRDRGRGKCTEHRPGNKVYHGNAPIDFAACCVLLQSLDTEKHEIVGAESASSATRQGTVRSKVHYLRQKKRLEAFDLKLHDFLGYSSSVAVGEKTSARCAWLKITLRKRLLNSGIFR
jgi:hypothetical protein